MNSNNGLIMIIAVVALIGGGVFYNTMMQGGSGEQEARPLSIAALAPEKQNQAIRAIDRVHKTDRETIQRVLETQANVLKEIGGEPVQRKKLCITGILENDAPFEQVDPAAGLATELVSECSVVIGWVEKLGGVFGGDASAKKLRRVNNLWEKYFLKPEDLSRRLSVEVETAILEFRARRQGFVSGIGGRSWADLQSQLGAAEATLLGSATPLTPVELQRLKKAGSPAETPYRTMSPGKLADAIVDAALEEAAATMGLELDLAAAAAASSKERPKGAAVWLTAMSRAVLAAAPKKQKDNAAASLEASIRETLAIAVQEAETALKRRLTEKLEAQQSAENLVLKRASAAPEPSLSEKTDQPSADVLAN